jgi:hypothetical protein
MLYAQAQDSTKVVKTYRNHIGINTQFAQDQFFNSSARTPIQLMYKRQNKKNNGAWRLGIGAMYRVDDSLWSSLRNNGYYYTFNGNFSFGYEWQKPITKKWLIYYGVDAQFAWKYKKFDGQRSYDIVINGVLIKLKGFDENYTITPALLPFLGGRFQLSNRFYLSTEISLQLHYEKNQRNIRFYTLDGTLSKGDIDYGNYGASFKPYSGIYLFYLL